MAERLVPVLTARQEAILARVVEAYVATGLPVGSKTLVEQGALDVSPSTVRNDLAVLEELGLLTHPHTSAGRVPSEQGYRFYAEVGVLESSDELDQGAVIEKRAERERCEARRFRA